MLGNLIALPLQKQPRERGNTVFLDDRFVPNPDQWAFLSTVHRISRSRLEDIVREAERGGRVVGVRLPEMDEEDGQPWAARPSRRLGGPPIIGELPRIVELVLGHEIYIAKHDLVPGL